MKKKSKLITTLVIILTFVAGYMLGLIIEFPKINNNQLAGTIGKLSNYRNTKATEADIELKNDLLNDEKLQQATSAYLSYYYSKSLEFAKSTSFALEQARTIPALVAQSDKLDMLGKYTLFLEESRKDLLMASMLCQSVENADPVVLRNSMNTANNIIARMNQANGLVIEFIDQLDAFIQQNGSAAYPELSRAHDRLVLNQIGSSLISKDKILLKYFDKKRLYAQDAKQEPVDVKALMLKDLKKLNNMPFYNLEQLGWFDKEMLRLKDAEKLGAGYRDNEKLGLLCTDIEQLGKYLDAEKLGAGYRDNEKLGLLCTDIEQLGKYLDAEKLGGRYSDAEQLGLAFDTEKLGVWGFDAEKLGGIMTFDSEKLGIIVPM